MKHNVEITFKNSETMMFENSTCGTSDCFFVLYMDINPENGESRETRFYHSEDIKHARKIYVPECKKDTETPEEHIRYGIHGANNSNFWTVANNPIVPLPIAGIDVDDEDDEDDI